MTRYLLIAYSLQWSRQMFNNVKGISRLLSTHRFRRSPQRQPFRVFCILVRGKHMLLSVCMSVWLSVRIFQHLRFTVPILRSLFKASIGSIQAFKSDIPSCRFNVSSKFSLHISLYGSTSTSGEKFSQNNETKKRYSSFECCPKMSIFQHLY